MVWGLSCQEDDKDFPHTGEPPADADTDSDADADADADVDEIWDYGLAATDTSACPVTPAARHFAQTVYFLADDPPILEGQDGLTLPVERGFIVHGGLSWPGPAAEDDGSVELQGEPLDDMWLYDLHNERECPWILLSEEASGTPTWGASALFDWMGQEILILGGEVSRDDTPDPVREVTTMPWAMPISAPVSLENANFEPFVLADQARFIHLGDEYCTITRWRCFDENSGVELQEVPFETCNGGLLEFYPPVDSGSTDCSWMNGDYVEQACSADPYCLSGGYPDGVWPIHLAGVYGLAAHQALVYDPALSAATLYGGTSGVDGLVGVTQHWLLAHPGLAAPEPPVTIHNLHGTNLEARVEVGALGHVQTLWHDDELAAEFRPEPWPLHPAEDPADRESWASSGIRHAAGVLLGRRFDHVLREYGYGGTPTTHVVLGGTLYQDFFPGHEYDVRNEDDPNCGFPDNSFGYTPCEVVDGVWEELDRPTSWTELGQAQGARERGQSSSTWSVGSWIAGLTPRVAPAAVAVERQALAVFGGRTASAPGGTNYARVFDRETGQESLVTTPAAFGARYGAGAVWDPVAQAGFVFGGSRQDGEVWRLTSANTLVPNVHSRFRMEEVELDLERSAGVWHVEEAFRLVHDCDRPAPVLAQPTTLDGSDPDWCFANEVDLLFRTGTADPAFAESAVVEFGESVSALEPLAANARIEVETMTNEIQRIRYRLPEALMDGDERIVRVTLDLDGQFDTNKGLKDLNELVGVLDVPVGGIGGVARGVGGLPVAVGWSDAEPLANSLAEVAVVRMRADASPAGWSVLAPGAPSDCGTAAFPLLGIAPTDGACFVDLPKIPAGEPVIVGMFGLVTLPERVVGSTTFRVLVDATLGPPFYDGAGGGTLQKWAAGDPLGRDLAEELAFLEERLGPFPPDYTNWSIVFVGVPAGTPTQNFVAGGSTAPGWVAVDTFPPRAPGAEVWRSTVLHELAHAWLGVAWAADDGVYWLIEGLPTLLETIRYPEDVAGGAVVFNLAVNFAVETRNFPANANPELGRNFVHTRYAVAPYVLAQLHHGARALGLTDADIWVEWRDLFARATPTLERVTTAQEDCGRGVVNDPTPSDGRPTLTHDELAELFDLYLGQPELHCERVHADAVGTPLLGLASLSYDPLTATGEAVVRQFQGDLLNWPLFTDVPFYLGCESVLVPGQAAFDGCAATRDAFVGPPSTVGEASVGLAEVSVPLVPNAALLGADPLPAQVGLVANHMLLPEQPGPAYLVSDGIHRRSFLENAPAAPTWQRRCQVGACLPDAPDGDGFPDDGDCDDTNPAVHPDAPVGSWLDPTSESFVLIDFNCDGWPTSSFE